MAEVSEAKLRDAVARAIDEEFCGTYGGESIADRVIEILNT